MAVTQEIRIIVTESGSRVVKRELSGVGQSAASSGSAVQFLRRQLGFLGAAFVARSVISLSDEFINLRNRIRTVIPDFRVARVALDELFEVANRTRSSIATTGETFARLAVSGRIFGLSSAATLRIIESLNQAIILSGANAQEARTGLIQLSQGFARGVLRGDELRSVLEQIPVVADLIADELKVTRFEIAKLGEQGLITGDVLIRAAQKAEQSLKERFGRTVPTIAQSFEILRNNVIRIIGVLNESSGAAESFANAVILLANNLDTALKILTLLAAILLRGRIISILTAAVGPVMFLARALQLLSVSLTTGGLLSAAGTLRVIGSAGVAAFGGWPVLILAAVAALALFSDKIVISKATSVTLKDSFLGAFEVIDKESRLFFDRLVNLGKLSAQEIGTSLTNSLVDSLPTIAKLVPGANILRPFLPQPTQLEGPPEPTALQKFKQAAENRVSLRKKEAEAAAELRKELEKLEAQKKKALELSKAEIALGFTIARLNEESAAFRIRDIKERELALEIAKQEFKLKIKFSELSAKARDAFIAAFRERQATEELATARDKALAPTRELAEGQRILNVLYDEGTITLKQYNDQLGELRQRVLEAENSVSAGFKAGLLEIQTQFTDVFGLAKTTVINAFQSMEDALVKFVETGKLNFSDLVRSILADITKLVIRKTIIAPLAGLLGLDEKGGLKLNGFGAGNAGGGGIFGELLGAVKGVGGLFSGASGGLLGSIFGLGKSLLGFANGGDFTVGGSGGTDSKVVAFRATPGERVSVRRPDDDGGQKPIVVNYFITTNDANSFKRSQGQILSKTASALGRAQSRNG